MNSAEGSRRAHKSWANTRDRSARTAAARTGLLEKFTREARERLGPGATERDIALAAESARKEHYRAISTKGVEARRRRRAA